MPYDTMQARTTWWKWASTAPMWATAVIGVALSRDILRARTDIDVVLHCHSIYATTLPAITRPFRAFTT
ncbi:hypothetical protein F2981_18270 (plasmid) [Sinorhizobium meliloti]|nr:hypothetical protein [Sinorhizobium meliloti]